ncbi:hypothetical protein CEP53_004659 [Fusarium sp. AF-6]|nr:hypothetical protein CEP53_004659 [Fusarium sp. AF-6]
MTSIHTHLPLSHPLHTPQPSVIPGPHLPHTSQHFCGWEVGNLPPGGLRFQRSLRMVFKQDRSFCKTDVKGWNSWVGKNIEANDSIICTDSFRLGVRINMESKEHTFGTHGPRRLARLLLE